MKNESADLYRRHGPMGPESAEPVIAAKGEGAWLEDSEGRRYLDFANGGSLPLGYTLGARSVARPGHDPKSSADFGHVPMPGADGVVWQSEVELMHKLAELVPGGMNRRVLVCDSGREALARAIELARAATGRSRTVYLSDLSDASDKSDWKSAISRAVAAVVAHPLDGRIKQVRQACDGAGVLLIDDETNIGPGATGRMFAIELCDVRPDIYVLGRGWAAGLPFGACVTGSSNLRWSRGSGGNPLGCVAALETIRLLEAGLLEQGRKLAAYMEKRFGVLSCAKLEPELYGVGLVRTTVFRKGRDVARGFVQKCRDLGLLLHVLSAESVAVRPPLVATEKDVDFAAEVVGKVLAGFDKKA